MKNSTRGFTLVETMIAVTILTLSIVGPMTTANRAIVAAGTARDQLSASYLAQEGIEYIRAVRDDQYLAVYPANTANAWTNFLNSSSLTPCRSASGCTLNVVLSNGAPTGALTLCATTCASSPFILATGGNQFTRTVQLVDVSANDERIVSKVTWSYHSTPYSVTITDHLTPWQ